MYEDVVMQCAGCGQEMPDDDEHIYCDECRREQRENEDGA